MNFFFAKLFEEYVRKNDSPKLSITLYISTIYSFLIFVFLLPIKTYIDKKLHHSKGYYEQSTIMIAVFAVMTATACIVYNIFIKKGLINRLTGRYRTKKINRVILYLIIPIAPVTLLLLAPAITVFLNGGEMFGNKIKGLLE